MKIILNDKELTIAEGTTVAQLLEDRGIEGRYVAVAIDQAIVKTAEWSYRELLEGEKVIVIGAIKGG